jgi:hypothetical protein
VAACAFFAVTVFFAVVAQQLAPAQQQEEQQAPTPVLQQAPLSAIQQQLLSQEEQQALALTQQQDEGPKAFAGVGANRAARATHAKTKTGFNVVLSCTVSFTAML